MGRRSLRAAAAVLVAVTAGTLAGPAAAHRYTYSIATRGDVEADLEWFRHIARTALSNERGWTLGGHNRFVEVPAGGDFRLILASPTAVNAASPVCDRPWSCRVGDDVLVNDYRWRHGTVTRPDAAPRRLPDWAWARLSVHLAATRLAL